MTYRSQVVGGITVRRRAPRYPGEPTYARLEYVRTKRVNDMNSWDMYPHRGYASRQAAFMNAYPQQQWAGGAGWPAQNQLPLGMDGAYSPYAPAYHQIQPNAYNDEMPWGHQGMNQQIPPPPPLGVSSRMLEYPNQHQAAPNMWDLGQVPEDDDDIVQVVDGPRWPRGHRGNRNYHNDARPRQTHRHGMGGRYDSYNDMDDEYPPPSYRRGRPFELSDDEDYNFGRPRGRWG